MNDLQRFLAVMEYQPVDRVPNWELGVWPQTVERWQSEGLQPGSVNWDWFSGDPGLGMDRKEFIRFGSGPHPAFAAETLADEGETEVIRDHLGRIRRALKTGAVGGGRASMDQYLRFAVETAQDWAAMCQRYQATDPARLEPAWQRHVPRWQSREHPLVFGPNCTTLGFYWIARDWMGTENLSLAWYDQPALMHEITEFWADFLIEASRPVLAATTVEYICLNEDMSFKSGPLLSPATYRQFIQPQLRRCVEFWKSHGVRYVAVDTDGNPELLVPALMEAGVDILWPLERAADQDPVRLRAKFGPDLRLWGGVDKRELAKGPAAIDAHLRELQPLVAAGGYVPTVDHTVPPDVSWDHFRHYLEAKQRLLAGEL